jgi:hypothetical protein
MAHRAVGMALVRVDVSSGVEAMLDRRAASDGGYSIHVADVSGGRDDRDDGVVNLA